MNEDTSTAGAVPKEGAGKTSLRKPTQARGKARVDAILVAASELIVEQGIAGVTMHALAHRSRTSIGSLYHFFADRESVLEAARERHRAATLAIAATLVDVPTGDWRTMVVAEVIERIVTPFIDYVGSRPDYVPLMRGQALGDDSPYLIRAMDRIIESRLPGLDAQTRADWALMLHLIAGGTMSAGLQFDASRTDLYTRELKRAMASYLGAVEQEWVERGNQRPVDEYLPV
ncbi:TetR/AcrR family transcriptional regulator [Luteibacter sp. ME-Dv--P-043b]|uniref:TetR/AcrR family transcriptional regulator n=1 Tax=Luteibacter sp. ME-Dv--P-043b TaxID=3040291 RepID=UPI002556FC53|nr:TetR/AcrR family transcriptional regulator [Luteibacter sp. ME-Dv--P-043b]